MIIFVTEQPYTFNLNGAAALSSSHLRFLAKKFPEKTIKIFFLNKNTVFWRESPDFDNSKIEVTLIDIPSTEFKILNLSSLRLIFESKIDYLAKEIFEFDSNFSQKISILQTFKNKAGLIDFIWCEHLIPVTYLFLILPIELISDKLIYSHHDFLFKILWKRAKSSKQIARFFLVRKLELMLLRKVTHFVTGSQFEFKQIQEINPRAKINFLPCFYPPMGSVLSKKTENKIKIYHVGTASATANKIGLQFFFKKVFPVIEHLSFALEFIGNVKEYILTEFPYLKDHPKITYHGYVENLDEIIENGMIHIIPYSGKTGTRTRIAGITRFNPCLLAFETAQDSYPFLSSGKNAILVKDDNDFSIQLANLISDNSLRSKISQNIATDMNKFEIKLINEITLEA